MSGDEGRPGRSAPGGELAPRSVEPDTPSRARGGGDLPALVDLHSHFVPGVDDGAPTLEAALSYLEGCHREGVRRVATTPHLPAGMAEGPYRGRVRDRFEELRRAAADRVPGLALSLGYEVRLDGSPLDASDEGLWLGKEGRMLVEYRMLRLPEDPDAPLEPLLGAGIVPVLAHPERYHGLGERWSWVARLREAGVLFCLNVGSIWGAYGPGPRSLARRFLERGQADLVGSDHHARPHRSDSVRRAWELLVEAGAERSARALLSDNPTAVLEGRETEPVPPVPRPAVGQGGGAA